MGSHAPGGRASRSRLCRTAGVQRRSLHGAKCRLWALTSSAPAYQSHRSGDLIKKVKAALERYHDHEDTGTIKHNSPKNNMLHHMNADMSREP